MPRSKVSVNTSPVAQRYADEKIIEFSSPNGGGLIAFRVMDDGQLRVEVYRTDETVTVSADRPVLSPGPEGCAAYTQCRMPGGHRDPHLPATGWTEPRAGADRLGLTAGYRPLMAGGGEQSDTTEGNQAMTMIDIDDTSPEFSADRDETGNVSLRIKAGDTRLRVNLGGSYDDAADLSTRLTRVAGEASELVSNWEDVPDPENDGFITLDRYAWYVQLAGQEHGERKHGYPRIEIAEYELARAMADAGEFPNAWAEGEHGPTTRDINDEVRKYHDEGGDKLRPLPGAVYQPGDVVIASDEDWRTWVVVGDYGDVPAGGLGIMLHTLGDPDVIMLRETHDNLSPDTED